MGISIVELLKVRAAQNPDRVAYTFLTEGETESPQLTFAQLDARARAIGAALQSAECAGGTALLLFPPGLEFITAFLGCLYAGTVAVPAYRPRKKRGLNRLAAIAGDAAPDLVLTTSSLSPVIQTWAAQTTFGFLFYQNPGLSLRSNPGCRALIVLNPERVRQLLNPFRVIGFLFYQNPGLSLRSNPGCRALIVLNPERVRQLLNPFRVIGFLFYQNPGLSLRSNPGLKLANAFGVTEIANAFGVTEIANAFGVTEIANAFGVTEISERLRRY
jgi:hypothetical protein